MATIRLIPSAYTSSNSSYATVYSGEANMYYNTDHTANYASLRGRNQNSTTAYYIFLRGFNFDDVPSDAIVSSFTVKIRCYRNSYQRTGDNYRLRLATTTNINNVVTNSITSTEIGTSASTITIPTGDLDWDTLNGYGSNFSIVIPLSSTSSSRPYVYVYGAEIEVTYTLPVYHTVSASSDVSGVTVSPSTANILEGNSATIEISSDGSTFMVEDNGTDVTDQLVSIPASGSETKAPNSYTNLSSGVTINSSYPIANAYDTADDSSDYCRLDFSTSTTGYIELLFDLPDLPSSATLTSVTARARLRVSSTSRMSSTICRLYAGSTAKGSNVTFATTTATLYNLTPGTWTVSELSTLRMRIGATSSSSTSSKYIYIYGADVTVSYTLGGEFYTYTISNVTTDHTVVITSGQVVLKTYKLASSLVPGKNYLIANGNSGSVYLLTNESGGSRQLVGMAATVSNNKISISSSAQAKAEFQCVRYTAGNDITITVASNNQYLYTNSADGLRMNSPATLDRFWHYQDGKFWQFKSTTNNGYTDTSTEYKYYLELNSSNNFTDNHVTSPSIQDTTLPAMYIFVEDDGSTEQIYIKKNGTWVQCSKVYLKVNGSWVEQDSSTWTTILPTTNNYQLINLDS